MKNKHWSHGIAEDSSDHTDPRLSTLLKCCFTFLGKKLVLPKAKAGCSSGDSLLQEFLFTARVLVPIKPHSTGTHVGIQLTPSVSSYKTINLKHCLHNSGILPWKIIIKNMYLCINAHTHVSGFLCALGSSAIDKLSRKDYEEIALPTLFRHCLVLPCTICTVLEDRSFLGEFKLLSQWLLHICKMKCMIM